VSWCTDRQRVESVDEWQVGGDVSVVMTNVNECFKQLGGEHSLEVATISLDAEQKSQSTQRVRLRHTHIHTHTYYTEEYFKIILELHKRGDLWDD